MARSVQSVAADGRRITDAATGAATSATQMERSIESVAAMARRADEVTRRVAAGRRGRRRRRAALDPGHRRGCARRWRSPSSVMREMGKRTNEISSIVDTINLIAERTNLLSLNASIEAARAGDAGRGFAVVAEEIRNLADRSAKATADIAAIIKALQEVAQEAVTASTESLRIADESNAVAEAGAAGLRKILTGVGETVELVGQIARATDEQRTAGRVGRRPPSRRRPSRRGWWRRPPPSRRPAAGTDRRRATGQMRKIAQEVTKAVDRTGARLARHHEGGAEHGEAGRGRCARRRASRARRAAQIDAGDRVDAPRRARPRRKAVAEQAIAAEQIAKAAGGPVAADRDGRREAMVEQATAADADHDGRRQHAAQSEQAAKRARRAGADDEGDVEGGERHRPRHQADHPRQPAHSAPPPAGDRSSTRSGASPSAMPPASSRRAAARPTCCGRPRRSPASWRRAHGRAPAPTAARR